MPCYHKKVYIDKRNNVFAVKLDKVYQKYKAYIKVDDLFISICYLPWRELVEDAQADLDELASLNGWAVMLDDREGENSEAS